ncbi:MAG: hypothetical protein KKF44_00060 [Nanoarchaeota archaeon]|nr:hypothetical protein [Nanoarchaeota archaeon]
MAKKKSWTTKVGPFAFALGLVIAVLASFTWTVVWYLGVFGLVVGLLNISDDEVRTYLLASLTFLVSASALSGTLTRVISVVPFLANYAKLIDSLLANVVLFVAPGAAIVALKALYMITKD